MPQTVRPTQPPSIKPAPWEPFPEIDLRQLLRMTDDTGMFQHAVYGMPDPNHGYCIDDNDRALIAALLYAQLRGYDERSFPLHRYLTFITYAYNEKTGTFRNFMGYDRRWLEEEGSQDSQGRTIWTLGLTVRHAPQPGIEQLARSYLHRGLPAVEKFGYIRSWAFALIGLDEYLHAQPDDEYATTLRDRFAEKLFAVYQDHATDDWPWWEDIVTYDNAKLSHALLVSGRAMGRGDMIEAGLASLRWLLEVQTTEDVVPRSELTTATPEQPPVTPEGEATPVRPKSGLWSPDEIGPHLSIIGNDGWLRRDGHRARFDQQPLEAYAMVHACLVAAEVTGDEAWAHHAWRCFEWFRGRNDLGVPLYNPHTGGCHDGLLPNGVNANQGAESILAYLLSVLELHRFRGSRSRQINVRSQKTVGYAIVGVSDFATFCLEQYRRIDGLKPVAVWNRTASKAHRLADDEGLKPYDDLAEMLRDPAVQLVHVATTPASHAELVLPALNAGKHVLCEKPLATDLVDAQRMIAAAAERDRVLSVNFMMRFGPLSEAIKRLIESGMLGAVLRGNFANRAGDAGLPADHWFWDASQSGGIFIEHGVHTFDLARWWLGRDGSVTCAQRMRRPGNPEIFDQVQCEVRYPIDAGPTTFDFYHGFLQPSPLDQQEFRFVFERGFAVATGWIPSELTLHAVVADEELDRLREMLPDGEVEIETPRRFEGDGRKLSHRHRQTTVDREVRVRWRDRREKQAIYGGALQALMEDVVEAIRDPGRRPRVTGDDGLAALRLAVDATRVAKAATY